MKNLLNTRMILSLHLVVIVLVVVIGAWSVHQAKKELRTVVTDDIEAQLETVTELAVLTDRNGADAVVEDIISDCANRNQFENLLGRLASLSHRELLSVQQLFDNCGSFHAERKAVMVSRFDREVEVLNEYITLLDTLAEDHVYSQTGSAWSELVLLEQERSVLLNEQVTIQQEIISELIRGTNILSTDISSLASRAQNIAEQLTVLDSRIDKQRIELTS